MRKYIVQDVKNIPLKTLMAIRDNGFRSKDCRTDYCPFEVDARIFELQEKKAELVTLTQPENAFDAQLFAMLEYSMPGQFLLNLIDQAYGLEITTAKQTSFLNYDDEVQIGFDIRLTKNGFTFDNVLGFWTDQDGGDHDFETEMTQEEENQAKIEWYNCVSLEFAKILIENPSICECRVESADKFDDSVINTDIEFNNGLQYRGEITRMRENENGKLMTVDFDVDESEINLETWNRLVLDYKNQVLEA